MHGARMNPGASTAAISEGEGEISSTIKISISHGSHQFEVIIPADSTFGNLKAALADKTGLRPQEQRLLFRGKEKDDNDYLQTAGVKNHSKIILLEEQKSSETNQQLENSVAGEAVRSVRAEVDKLAEKVDLLAVEVAGGARISDKELIVLPELLMRQLLKLDGIEAEGEARAQRRSEVQRVQRLVEILDALKAKNDDPFRRSSSGVSAEAPWETTESTTAPPRTETPDSKTQDWVRFD